MGRQAPLSWERPTKKGLPADSMRARAATPAEGLRAEYPSRSQPGRALLQPAARRPMMAAGADSTHPRMALRAPRTRLGAIPKSARVVRLPGAVEGARPKEAMVGVPEAAAEARSKPALQGGGGPTPWGRAE